MRTEESRAGREQALTRLAENGTPAHIVGHCKQVAGTARRIALALSRSGLTLDADLVERAALLHDMVRTEEDHAEAAYELLKDADPAAAEIIRGHMTRSLPADVRALTEADIVSLADRSVLEDRYVGYRPRMEAIARRHAPGSEAETFIRARIRDTEGLLASMEEFLGEGLDAVASGGQLPVRYYLSRVERPGRYIGNEIHAVKKDPEDVAIRFCLAFPDLYEIGMSYTGLQILVGLLNERADVYCERTFAPAQDMEDLMRAEGFPLFTVDTHTDVKRMDFLGFTLQYEHSYSNVIHMLNLAQIPVRSSARAPAGGRAPYPLLIAGGPCCYNPEPLADVFDIILIGDAEETLPLVMDAYARADAPCDTAEGKEKFLREIAHLPGIYIPKFYTPVYEDGRFVRMDKVYADLPDRVQKAVVVDLDAAYFPGRPIVPLIETVHGRAVVELFRGCGRGCRFCQAGFVYRPVRRRSKERILQIIDEQLANTGYDEVSLLSLSTGDYPGIEDLTCELMDRLTPQDVSLSLPSLRLDSISEEVLARIGAYKKSGLTFAPEAGTQRLRDVVHKNITEDDIFRSVQKAVAIGWTRVKFYFMIGMPTETRADLDGIVDLAERVCAMVRGMQEPGKRNFHLTVSVSNFVPKPNTPFQWARANTEEELKEKNFYLKDRFKKVRGVQFQFHDTRSSYVETMLARGDRRTLAAILAAVEAGCKFDSWREHFRYDLWREAFEKSGAPANLDPYPDTDAPLPWDVIDDGTDKALLISQWNKALALADPAPQTEAETAPETRA
ncbi:MAG: TIGR03960 family B12-binding radical SAM protein [Clostridiales Family XIII bacterium]|jgi:radical SAM family uncharacterized protein|nr:TIGR03960 family B12-binding radical SAM protein [Clostridiales Family XIII bacterium]